MERVRTCLGQDEIAGWEFLRTEFEGSPLGAFGDFLFCGPDLAEYGRIGAFLRDVRREPGFPLLIERLRSAPAPRANEDYARADRRAEAEVRGALAEIRVLATLRRRGVRAGLIQTVGTHADVVLRDAAPECDIEVSHLGITDNYTTCRVLEERLTRRLLPMLVGPPRRNIALDITCNGYPGPLLAEVDAACRAFEARLDDPPDWTAQLTPGLTFAALQSPVPQILNVHGATVIGADPYANESVLLRLPAKIEEEAHQVRPGGVVLIFTTELSAFFSGITVPDDGMTELVSFIANVGERADNVGAFAVLDEMGGTVEPLPTPQPPNMLVAAAGMGEQRLLWIPNPHARTSTDPRARDWLTPPFVL